jgi:hypothetical protein
MPLTTLELPRNVRNTHSGNSIEGYFRAPKTGNYRFYMACDDQCRFQLATESLNPASLQSYLTLNSHTSYRNYFGTLVNRRTEWIPLVEGEFYYMQVDHI